MTLVIRMLNDFFPCILKRISIISSILMCSTKFHNVNYFHFKELFFLTNNIMLTISWCYTKYHERCSELKLGWMNKPTICTTSIHVGSLMCYIVVSVLVYTLVRDLPNIGLASSTMNTNLPTNLTPQERERSTWCSATNKILQNFLALAKSIQAFLHENY